MVLGSGCGGDPRAQARRELRQQKFPSSGQEPVGYDSVCVAAFENWPDAPQIVAKISWDVFVYRARSMFIGGGNGSRSRISRALECGKSNAPSGDREPRVAQ